jgi:hypothetical protein
MKRKDTTGSAAGPIDAIDRENLRRVQEAFAAADPMPADLPERIRFALALANLEAEVARLVAQEDHRSLATRGEEQSRTITFDSESLTIMIRIDANEDGTVRVDGWLAPAQRREIEMRTGAELLAVASDDQGRFAFARVPRGTAQLVVRAPTAEPGASTGPGGSGRSGGTGRSVVTPALIL